MPITESNVYGLWVAKQDNKGATLSAATKQLVQTGGDIDLNREDGSENYSDLTRFGNSADFVNTISGQGTPSINAQPDSVAYLLWLFFGGEAWTAGTGSIAPKYVFTPGSTTGYFSTWWKRVGLTQPVRQKFADCKITSLKIEGSTANKIVKVMPEVHSLTPGLTFATDPTPSQSTQRPFLYTDAVGTFTIHSGTTSRVFTGQTQFGVTIDDGQAPVQGDATTYSDFVAGNASITMDGPTILLDANGLALYNELIYGTASPAAGTSPITTAPVVGSYSCEFSRGTGASRESLKIEIPGVKWNPNLAVAPNPDGGAIELALGGAMRKISGSPAITITVETGSTGETVAHVA